MKIFFYYALFVVLFFILSDILININFEVIYQNICRKDRIEQISIYQAQATKINGRIKGTITNDSGKLNDKKYLQLNLYSERDNILGTKYIDISDIKENESKEIKLYFKIQDVEYYEFCFTDEKVESEIELLPTDMSKNDIIWGTFLAFLIFW